METWSSGTRPSGALVIWVCGAEASTVKVRGSLTPAFPAASDWCASAV